MIAPVASNFPNVWNTPRYGAVDILAWELSLNPIDTNLTAADLARTKMEVDSFDSSADEGQADDEDGFFLAPSFRLLRVLLIKGSMNDFHSLFRARLIHDLLQQICIPETTQKSGSVEILGAGSGRTVRVGNDAVCEGRCHHHVFLAGFVHLNKSLLQVFGVD